MNQIHLKIVEWYIDHVTFLVDKDNYFVEAIIPRTTWVDKLPCEVFEDECMYIVDIILKIPRDVNANRFGTYKEVMCRCVGKRSSKIELVPKGKHVKRSSKEVYASSSKVLKGKWISKKFVKAILEMVCV